jgi:hypothetical protein
MDISKLFVRDLQRELVQRNLNDKAVKAILSARLQAAIDGNLSSSEMTTEQEAVAEKTVADQALADKGRMEQEIRDSSAKDAAEQEYPGDTDTRERVRAPVRPKVREVMTLVSPKFQQLLKFSVAIGDAQWWDEVSDTETRIEAIRKEDMQQEDKMVVVAAIPNKG